MERALLVQVLEESICKTLPTKAPWVIQGPGENAGVIDIGDGLAVRLQDGEPQPPVLHRALPGRGDRRRRHPARRLHHGRAADRRLNALRFGAPDHPKTRHLVAGVVAGIGGYGNSFGVPTVGGEVQLPPRYDGNILVNAMAVGIAETDKIFYSAATGVGMPVVYLGSKTGRDGIHGATMASAEFDEDSEEKRPTVQVGDPFTEKLLLEACLELMATDCVVAIQDMGAAGLTCSAVEMGAKGDLGIELDLDKVPCRETGMTRLRDDAVGEPGAHAHGAQARRRKPRPRRSSANGSSTSPSSARPPTTCASSCKHDGEVVADLPIKELGDEAPVYDRPLSTTPKQPVRRPQPTSRRR